jgi:hypothetical protein
MEFATKVKSINPNLFLVSYDVESLFTNIPIKETIEIILNALFPTSNTYYAGLNRLQFKTLLELAVCDSHFLFNNSLYKQTEGMAMGSPLGPTFANIFMNNLESDFLDNCSTEFKPILYNRYVDDTITAFQNQSHAIKFLDYINKAHPNIKFTMDTEINNKINFLDIQISRVNNEFSTNVFRKICFTGQGLNFYSYCPEIFKINACKTLIHRAYTICSDWLVVSREFKFLEDYFLQNCYPSHIFSKCVKNYVNNIFQPRTPVPTVAKDVRYFSFPYIGFKTTYLQKELTRMLSKLYPSLDVKLIFCNPYRIGTLFKFKDALVPLMRSNVVYLFNCPTCDVGKYIGCTTKLLKVRVSNHMGVSHRTHNPLNVKENSAIRNHCSGKCNHPINYKDFKILFTANNKNSLHLAESLFIKSLAPDLNSDLSSIPLLIS